MKTVRQFWLDESAAVVSTELVVVLAVLVVAMVAGFTALRDSLTAELANVAAAIEAVGEANQSYSFAGIAESSTNNDEQRNEVEYFCTIVLSQEDLISD